MRDKGFRNPNLATEDLIPVVGVFLAAAVATYSDVLREHGKGLEGVGFSQQDAMLVAEIGLVVESAILANYHPEIIGVVLQAGLTSAASNRRAKIHGYFAPLPPRALQKTSEFEKSEVHLQLEAHRFSRFLSRPF
jgi:hypothetical protein